jgi:hypothetical protein
LPAFTSGCRRCVPRTFQNGCAPGRGYGALLDGAGAAIAGRLDALEAKLEEQAEEAGV